MFLTTLIAQSINISPGGQFSGLNNITIANIIGAIITLILIITVIILLVVLLVGGITVMTSGGGDPQKTARGQQAVTAALIGLVIVFGAWAILNLLHLFFGIELLRLNIPSAQNP